MKNPVSIACTALLVACTGTTLQHQAVPQAHTMEYFSISSIDVSYRTGLTLEEEVLMAKYSPGELVAEKIRGWAEETGMWGGTQSLVLEVYTARLRQRASKDDYESSPLDDDRLGVVVEVRQEDRVLHRMDVVRDVVGYNQSAAAQMSGDRAIRDLIADVAWHIVYEMTPPGYDEAIIRAGHRDGVAPATVIAARRGLLGYGQMLKAISTYKLNLADPADVWCGSTLAKPSWIHWRLWAPFTYKKCEARAAEAARRK